MLNSNSSNNKLSIGQKCVCVREGGLLDCFGCTDQGHYQHFLLVFVTLFLYCSVFLLNSQLL